ncbi:MAG: thioredoxin domain-containing protein [bacterium]
MNDKLDRLLTVVFVGATVAVAVVGIHREFFPRKQLGGPSAAYVKEWPAMFASGNVIGKPGAPVQIVEFMDMQCPFCKEFHESVSEMMETSPGRFAVSFIHFPMSGHRQAIAAARAVECAKAEGRLPQLVNVLFAKQDSLGQKGWASYASEAGIKDTTAIARCAENEKRVEQIDRDAALAKRMGVHGTPTLFINGWRFDGNVDRAELVRVIKDIQEGTPPYDKRS